MYIFYEWFLWKVVKGSLFLCHIEWFFSIIHFVLLLFAGITGNKNTARSKVFVCVKEPYWKVKKMAEKIAFHCWETVCYSFQIVHVDYFWMIAKISVFVKWKGRKIAQTDVLLLLLCISRETEGTIRNLHVNPHFITFFFFKK